MTTADVFNLWRNEDLRNHIEDLAASFNRKKDYQETLRAKAWIAIGGALHNKTPEYYVGLAYATMRHHYEIYQMPPPKTWASHDKGNRRARRKVKKIIHDG